MPRRLRIGRWTRATGAHRRPHGRRCRCGACGGASELLLQPRKFRLAVSSRERDTEQPSPAKVMSPWWLWLSPFGLNHKSIITRGDAECCARLTSMDPAAYAAAVGEQTDASARSASACAFCPTIEGRVLIHAGDIPGKLPILRCPSCGVVFFERRYPIMDYWAGKQEAIYEAPAVLASLRRDAAARAARLRELGAPGPRLLDVGCGTGLF